MSPLIGAVSRLIYKYQITGHSSVVLPGYLSKLSGKWCLSYNQNSFSEILQR